MSSLIDILFAGMLGGISLLAFLFLAYTMPVFIVSLGS